ncbi:hypothetical protein N3K66_000654 [Trichothecium roseum]|uniref:Uncharacterized protein n=1 Tax=Trichothecium roseum TaxID=47278 RepID=A0ACC0VE74_9HYPO|nr:hypothetical protein N3K66_000654 [Trichothecium roseum]
MGNDTLLTDDYVADILAKEANDCSLKYSAMGMEAFRSADKKPANMPKPNTRFLRHIIKDTDTHNKALLAKEAAESKARLEDLEHTEEVKRLKTNPNNKDIRRRQMGDIRAILGGKRPRTETDDDAATPSSSRRGGGGGEKKDREDEGRRRARASRGESTAGGDLFTARDDERRRHGRLRTDDDNEDSRSHRREKRSSRRKDNDDRGGSDRRRRHRRDRSRSRSVSQSCDRDRRRRSRSPGEAGRKRRHRHRSPVRESKGSRARGRETNDDGSEPSDASQDDLIGPAPPPIIRGRGRLAGASGIDRRFSESYDPKADVQMDDDDEGGSGSGSRWDNDVEAFRDRQKLRQAQEERLRSAGFDEEQIQRAKGGSGQKKWDVDDVKWTKAGEQREWDRGKDLSDEEL